MRIEHAAAPSVSMPDRSAHLRQQSQRAKRKRQPGSLRVAIKNHLALIEKQGGVMTDADRRSLDGASAALLAQTKAKAAKLR